MAPVDWNDDSCPFGTNPQRPQHPPAGAVSFSLGRLPGTNGGLPSSGIVLGPLLAHETTDGQPRPRPAQRWGRFLSAMRYRDIEYTVVQGIGRQLWKWAVSFESIHLRGQGATKSEAIAEAERAIDRALAPKKLRLVRREID